jgi:hypothetical protein
MPYTINNPGGGDCGFYAFAIGLIDIIQNEHKLYGESNTFNRWKMAGLTDLNLQALLDINLKQLHQSPYDYKKEQLFILQMSLRNISVNVSKQDLFSRIKAEALSKEKQTLIEGSMVYGKFMELVHFYLNKRGSLDQIGQFNELALSPKVLELAENTAKSLNTKIQGKSFAHAQIIENAHVKKILLSDVLSRGKINTNSPILKSLDKVKEQGRWATHNDLKEIAAQLDVNLHVVGKINGKMNPDYPTVSLSNAHNAHWTTRVDQLPKPTLTMQSVVKDSVPLQQTAQIEAEVPQKKKRKITKEHEHEKTFSMKEEQIINATVSTQIQQEKVEQYRKNIKELIDATSNHGLFAQVKNKIDINAINTAEASPDESDESFAARLQEAELRHALKW